MTGRTGLALGLDAGGSGSGWSLLRGGRPVASGQAPALSAGLLDTDAGRAALLALAAALPGRPEAAHAGVPGLTAGSGQAAEVAAALARALNLDAAQVSVEGDLDLAYRAHLAPGSGVLLYAGTGAVAYHVAQDGTVTRAGGYGYKIGDDGGGFALGRAALRVLTDDLDRGDLPAGPLAEEVAALAGGLDWPALRAHAYGTPGAGPVAALAPAVGRAAERGDARAEAILTGTARDVAALARQVLERVGALPVTATGGALRGAAYAAALRRALPGASVQQRDHAEAAARVAAVRVGGA